MNPVRPFRLVAAPIRGLMRSRLFQLVAVVAIVLLLDHYSFDYAPLREISIGLKSLADATVQFCAEHFFRVGILTDPVLEVGLIIAYVYIVCLFIVLILRAVMRGGVEAAGRNNFLWLRNAIARERGIAAYRAWAPLESIRPKHIPQQQWEERYAWPADNKPPYPPLALQVLYGVVIYLLLAAIAAMLLQLFTPFPVITWLIRLIGF
jgi:hypothetical protein